MSVICFASLKGGVGKTSLSVNVSHALATQGNRVVLIDGDPTSHASRFFSLQEKISVPDSSPLAQLFLSTESKRLRGERKALYKSDLSVFDLAEKQGIRLTYPVRDNLEVIPASSDLRHFLWVGGSQFYKVFFPRLIEELEFAFDYIIIDTAPDFNVITRNAVASADLVVVPVDSSEMSIHSLEDIVTSAAHIRGPAWAIVRSMVNKQAKRVHRLTQTRLQKNLGELNSLGDEPEESNLESGERFLEMLKERELNGEGGNLFSEGGDESPIYLLNPLVYRTEKQNMLTFSGKTAFDSRQTRQLAEQYTAVAQELEEVLCLAEEEDSPPSINSFIDDSVPQRA